MFNSRRLSEHRPSVLLVLLVISCVVSLASDTKANVIGHAVRTSVGIVAYPFWLGLSWASNAIDTSTAFVVDFHRSEREAEHLRGELHALMPRVADHAELDSENKRLRKALRLERAENRLLLEPTEVIDAPVIGHADATLIVNKGGLHGIRPSMCAITEDGIVGIVREVQPTYSRIYTLRHPQFRVGAMIKRNRVRAIVHGSGSDISSACRMEGIDLKDDVYVGDEVVTVEGSLYPAGLPIGKVARVPNDGTILKAAHIEPAADPYRSDEIFIVKKAQLSISELTASIPMSETADPNSEIGGHPMPDTRSLQERYAP